MLLLARGTITAGTTLTTSIKAATTTVITKLVSIKTKYRE